MVNGSWTVHSIILPDAMDIIPLANHWSIISWVQMVHEWFMTGSFMLIPLAFHKTTWFQMVHDFFILNHSYEWAISFPWLVIKPLGGFHLWFPPFAPVRQPRRCPCRCQCRCKQRPRCLWKPGRNRTRSCEHLGRANLLRCGFFPQNQQISNSCL